MIPPHYINQILVGDALDYLRPIGDGAVPLFFFSPPYNLNRRANRSGTSPGITRGVRLKRLAHSRDDASYAAHGGHGKWKQGTAYEGYDDALPHAAYVAWQQQILAECWRCLADDGAIMYVHKPRVRDGECITPLAYAPPDLILRQIVIWKRAGGVNMAPTHYMPTHEWVCIWAKPAFRLRSKGASGVGDVWSIPQEPNTWHPAPFPLALAVQALNTVRRPAIVVDPFAGSGITCRAAKLLGIPYAGNDRSASYVARARRELVAAAGAGFAAIATADTLPLFEEAT